jgi:hypothetical protein
MASNVLLLHYPNKSARRRLAPAKKNEVQFFLKEE